MDENIHSFESSTLLIKKACVSRNIVYEVLFDVAITINYVVDMIIMHFQIEQLHTVFSVW